MRDFNFTPNRNPIDEQQRTLGQQYVPASISDTSLRLVTIVNAVSSISLSVGNNVMSTFGFTLFSTDKNPMLVVFALSIYIGSTETPLVTLLPGGSGVNSSSYKVFGPIKTPYKVENGEAAEDYENMIRVGILNQSGSTKQITVTARYRYIINSGGTT